MVFTRQPVSTPSSSAWLPVVTLCTWRGTQWARRIPAGFLEKTTWTCLSDSSTSASMAETSDGPSAAAMRQPSAASCSPLAAMGLVQPLACNASRTVRDALQASGCTNPIAAKGEHDAAEGCRIAAAEGPSEVSAIEAEVEDSLTHVSVVFSKKPV